MKRFRIRILGLLTALLCWSAPAGAQSVADSLLRELAKAPPDTHRVSLLYNFAWEKIEEDPDLAEKYLWEAQTLAQKLGFVAGEGDAWNGLGGVEEVRGNWRKAIAYYQKSLYARQKAGEPHAIANIYSNLGKSCEYAGDFDQALLYQREHLKIREALRDTAGIARAHLRIGSALQEMGIYPEAYDHINQYRQFVEDQNDQEGMARAYTQLGHVRFELEMLQESRRWYEQALKLREILADSVDLADAITDLGNVLDEMDTARTGMAIPYYMRALNIREALQDDAGIAQIYNNLGTAYKHLKQFDKAQFYADKSLKMRTEVDDRKGIMESYNTIGDILFGQKRLRESLAYIQRYFDIATEIKDEKFRQKGYKDLAKVYAELGDFKKALEYRILYDELRYSRLDENRARDFERKEVLFSEGRKQQEIERQQNELKLRDAQLARNRVVGFALLGGALALALLAGLLFNRARTRARVNRELAAKNEAIERERERADSLLKNILPEATAEELKRHNTVQPVRYDSVSVMFTDFKGFTTIAEKVSPEALIAELDECFRLFDAIMSKYSLEKIKTIGDSYMCAGGLPIVNNTHALDMVNAAIEMQRTLQDLRERKNAEGKPWFEMRVGINTGPVVAGVVGSHKFAYDIWGDTVNTAARLEQGSLPHKINISAATYALVKDHFTCTYRGKLAAKNKGEIEMYFVEY